MAKIGDVIDAENARWTFANKTRTQFEQHIEKSVPFYNEGHKLALGLSDFFLTKNSVCYDIGCSTATLLKIWTHTMKIKGFSSTE